MQLEIATSRRSHIYIWTPSSIKMLIRLTCLKPLWVLSMKREEDHSASSCHVFLVLLCYWELMGASWINWRGRQICSSNSLCLDVKKHEQTKVVDEEDIDAVGALAGCRQSHINTNLVASLVTISWQRRSFVNMFLEKSCLQKLKLKNLKRKNYKLCGWGVNKNSPVLSFFHISRVF